MTEHAQTQTTHRATSLRAIWRHLLRDAALSRSRQQLTLLDDHQLRDIGLTRDEAEAEAARPTWDVPRTGVADRTRQKPAGIQVKTLEIRRRNSDIRPTRWRRFPRRCP